MLWQLPIGGTTAHTAHISTTTTAATAMVTAIIVTARMRTPTTLVHDRAAAYVCDYDEWLVQKLD